MLRVTLAVCTASLSYVLPMSTPALGQTLYRIEKEPPAVFVPGNDGDLGNGKVARLAGFYPGADEDFDLHSFAWRDGYSTTNGQPTFALQVALHRKPEATRHVPEITSARFRRSLEWRIPVIATTYFIYPHYANPYGDKPLAILSGTRAEDGFKATVGALPVRNLTVRAVVEHRGTEAGENYSFTRTYLFRPPTVAVVDGRHEPYELYHWLW